MGGCPSGAPLTQPVRLSGAAAAPTADVADLTAVLAAAVTDDGRIDPAALRSAGGRLDAQLRKLAVTGPTATPEVYPTYGSRWAYWHNARAAWSMKLALLAGCPRRPCLAAMAGRTFRLDGRELSLGAIDEILLAEARRTGDFRLAACAPGVRVAYGPMPRRAYGAGDFGVALKDRLSVLVRDERRFEADVAARTVRVGPMLWACRNLVIARYHRDHGGSGAALLTALRPYVDAAARRRLEEFVGYAAAARGDGGELAIPRRKVYFPGKMGRVEP